MRLKGLTVTVLGDVSVETSSNLRDVEFADVTQDLLLYSPLRVEPGGSALNFALAATEWFDHVNLMAKVGSDLHGEALLMTLASHPVHSLVEKTTEARTGCSIYLRDASKTVEKGHRLLVVDRGANRRIDVAYVERHRPEIAASSVFFLDGYSFLEPDTREAAELAMRISRQAGTAVAFDLVPHDAHLRFTDADVKCWIEASDLVIAEVRTFRRAMRLESEDEVLDPAIAFETLKKLHDLFPDKSFHLRFGVGNIDTSLIAEPPGDPVIRENNYPSATQTRGFGDHLSAKDVALWTSRRHA
jgi:sugar/nucleoside kinase (ribokinase family)